MHLTALIDADIIAFRAASACEQTFTWAPGEVSKHVDVLRAQQSAVETVESWRDLAGCKDVICAFTGMHNFRKLVLPTYKGNRVKGKPDAYWQTVEAIKERFPCRVIDGLEADDVLGILATTDRWIDRTIVVTLDKDLRTVPGRHFNPTKDRRPVAVGEAEADHKWLLQTLHGDTTDNYCGIPGVGPKRAEAILGRTGGWAEVVAGYAKAGLTEAAALQQARVARILRRSDYDKGKKAVLLWGPRGSEVLPLEDIVKQQGKQKRGK